MKTSALRIQLAAFLALSLAVLWAFTLYEMQSRERHALDAAEAQTRGIAQAYAENALATIQRIDLILVELGRTWVTHPNDFRAEIQRHQQNIADVSIQVSIADEAGWIVFTNLGVPKERISVADREHIRTHFGATESRLFISKPVLGRVSGKWSLQFTRPLLRDGRFDGVIVISVSPELFSRFYRALSLGAGGITTMVRDSGDVMARAPDWERYMGHGISGTPYLAPDAPAQGSFLRVSQLDGVERLFGYYRLPQYGLNLTTGLSTDELLAPVRRQSRLALGITVAVSAIFALMALAIQRSLRAREQAEAQARQLNGELAQRTEELEVHNAKLSHEISERLHATRGLKLSASAIGNAPEGILVTDAQNKIILVNAAFSTITGYAQEEVLGRNPNLLSSGAQDVEFYRAMWQRLTRHHHWQGEITNRRKDGTTYLEWLSVSVVLDEAGRPSNYIGVFSDISERKGAEVVIRALNDSLEQRVRERTNELELANRKLESFSYSISHDLRAPLRAIHGFAAIIQESAADRLSEEEQGYFERIMANANRMGDLIDDILKFSRISRAEIEIAEVDTAALVQGVVSELRAQHPNAEISVAALPRVHADATLLRQVFENLLSNALKFSSKRERPRVEIGCDGRESAEALFWVRDNGAGFDMKYASHLFGVFQRLHSGSEFPGTGVGLSIVKNVIERHKGRIWAESAPDAGATFFFTIP